jgi:hypothetical protein
MSVTLTALISFGRKLLVLPHGVLTYLDLVGVFILLISDRARNLNNFHSQRSRMFTVR